MEDIVNDNIDQEYSIFDWVKTGIAPVVLIYGSSYFTIDQLTKYGNNVVEAISGTDEDELENIFESDITEVENIGAETPIPTDTLEIVQDIKLAEPVSIEPEVVNVIQPVRDDLESNYGFETNDVYEMLMDIQIIYYFAAFFIFFAIFNKIFRHRNEETIEIIEEKVQNEEIIVASVENPEDQVIAAEVAKKNHLLRGLSSDMAEEKVEPEQETVTQSASGTKRRVSFVLDRNDEVENEQVITSEATPQDVTESPVKVEYVETVAIDGIIGEAQAAQEKIEIKEAQVKEAVVKAKEEVETVVVEGVLDCVDTAEKKMASKVSSPEQAIQSSMDISVNTLNRFATMIDHDQSLEYSRDHLDRRFAHI